MLQHKTKEGSAGTESDSGRNIFPRPWHTPVFMSQGVAKGYVPGCRGGKQGGTRGWDGGATWGGRPVLVTEIERDRRPQGGLIRVIGEGVGLVPEGVVTHAVL